jgi:murein DD-endopeptidase MepM/ murein hydrolase activator NlpD
VLGTGNLGKYAYGRWIAIDHNNGIVTLYGHLSAVQVTKGEKVDKGDKIGSMGSTGYSTGNHLHFTVFSSDSYDVVPSATVKGLNIPIGATVDPRVYLPD